MHDSIWSATIDCLLVHKNYQNKGIGTTLIRKMLDELINIKYVSVSPSEQKNNRLYCKCGFIIVDNSSLLQIQNR